MARAQELRRACLLGLLLTLSAAAQGRPRFRWPALDVVEEIPIHGVVHAQGTPVLLKSLIVREPLAPLVQRFATAFGEAGLYLMPGKEQPQLSQMPMLTAVDPSRRLTYTVFFKRGAGATTQVILSEANFALRSDTPPGEAAPLHPAAQNVLRSSDEGGKVISFTVKASEAEVRAFYAKSLGNDGWSREKRPEDDEEIFRRGSQTLQLFTEETKSARSVVLLIRER